jgi:flagellar biosynthetic protein FliR
MNLVALAAALQPGGLAAATFGFLVFVRVGAATALLPAFGETSVPGRVRIGLALALTALVTPAVAGQGLAPVPLTAGTIVIEALAGLVIGLGFRLLVMALQTAGTIAAQATALAQILGTPHFDPQPAIGQVLVIGGIALAASAGLHVRVVEVFVLSYEAMPMGQVAGAAAAAEWGVGHTRRAFALAFALAVPFAIGSLLYNVALGAINRALPQLMVALIGAPALSFGALALLAISAPVALSVWQATLAAHVADPFAVPR